MISVCHRVAPAQPVGLALTAYLRDAAWSCSRESVRDRCDLSLVLIENRFETIFRSVRGGLACDRAGDRADDRASDRAGDKVYDRASDRACDRACDRAETA